VRLPFRYSQILYTLKGNYHGATARNNIVIPGIAYIINHPQASLLIFTVESRGYRIFDPAFNYSNPQIVNQQEDLDLDALGDEINVEVAESNAYTEHPTQPRS
jgi:hypothetical protein